MTLTAAQRAVLAAPLYDLAACRAFEARVPELNASILSTSDRVPDSLWRPWQQRHREWAWLTLEALWADTPALACRVEVGTNDDDEVVEVRLFLSSPAVDPPGRVQRHWENTSLITGLEFFDPLVEMVSLTLHNAEDAARRAVGESWVAARQARALEQTLPEGPARSRRRM